jgi:hypothetical protein
MSNALLNARYLIQTVSGVGPYQTSGLFYDNTGTWLVTQVTVGDEIFDENARRYRISNIITQVGSTLVADVIDVDSAGNGPALGNGCIYRPTVNYGFPVTTTEQNGITEFLKEFIRNNSVIGIDAAIQQIQNQYQNIETLVMTPTDISVGYVVLTYAPQMARGIACHVVHGTTQEYGTDFTIVSNNRLTFVGDLATLLEAGDVLVVAYSR